MLKDYARCRSMYPPGCAGVYVSVRTTSFVPEMDEVILKILPGPVNHNGPRFVFYARNNQMV
jgi:hypothetical protein